MLGVLLNRVEKNEPLISTIFGLLVVTATVLLIGRYLTTLRPNQLTTLPDSNPSAELELPLSQPSGDISATAISTYTVVAGDTLWSLAERFTGSGYEYLSLAALNQLPAPYDIEVGQVLNIPVASDPRQSGDVALQVQEADSYTVAPGDSLWSIATTVTGDGYKWLPLWHLNQDLVSNPNVLHVGTVLRLTPELYN